MLGPETAHSRAWIAYPAFEVPYPAASLNLVADYSKQLPRAMIGVTDLRLSCRHRHVPAWLVSRKNLGALWLESARPKQRNRDS